MKIDFQLTPADLMPKIERLWAASAPKILSIDADTASGGDKPSPVFTRDGRYTAQGWTEWTQGFCFGSAILQFDATGEQHFLDIGRNRTLQFMAPHLTHIGVHDHGFNNLSTYGNLRRLARENAFAADLYELHFYELALKISGAVQAARWTKLADGTGFIHSFNGPHSLFIDTLRSCRSLAVAHMLGHVLMGEQDARINLLDRLIDHARNTARYNVYLGTGRDMYDSLDFRGRVAQESIFNVTSGEYRCPSTQQGYSPFSTWTRGLSWAMLGFAELLEFSASRAVHGPGPASREVYPDGVPVAELADATTAVCDFYIRHTPADGIPYWDTAAPNLHKLGDWQAKPADPFNAHEPVDSSAAAVAAQGLLRLGRHLQQHSDAEAAKTYFHAGLTVLKTLFDEPYLCTDTRHQGLILHSVYHRPNGWDHVRPGQSVPNGESSMWGDYHAREVALYIQRLSRNQPYLTFFGPA